MNSNIIYKYFKIDEYFYRSIANNYLWFSDPTNFNDPYDFNLSTAKDFDENDLRNYFSRIQSQGNSALLENQIERRIEEFKNNADKFKSELLEFERSIVNQKYGVCCFSEFSELMLMWSHYGDKHQGICLGFDRTKDKNFFENSLYVTYPPEYPSFNFVKDRFTKAPGDTVKFHMGTKSRDWEYEKEIRIIHEKEIDDVYRGAVKFKKEALVEVIFGYKTVPTKIEELKKLFKQCGYSADFKQAKLKEYEFGLDIRLIGECRE